MAGVDFGTYTDTAPVAAWAADYRNRDHLVPAPARLAAAQFTADADGKRRIPSGTPVGRTLAERNAGTGYGPAATTDGEIFLLAFDVTDADANPDCELYRHGSAVKENFLPGFGSMATELVTALRSRYLMFRGVE